MARFNLGELIDALRKYDVPVEVVAGASTRGAANITPKVFVGHHTAGPSTGDRPSLNIVIHGRPDLDGPLANVFLTRGGVAVIVACGTSNNAGAGGFRGVTGNQNTAACEAESAGQGDWTSLQLRNYPRVAAAFLDVMGRDASWYCSHRTWAPTRKIDPKGLSDDWMRVRVAALLANPAPPTEEGLSVADMNTLTADIAELKRGLDLIWRGDDNKPGERETHPQNLTDVAAKLNSLDTVVEGLAVQTADIGTKLDQILALLNTPPTN